MEQRLDLQRLCRYSCRSFWRLWRWLLEEGFSDDSDVYPYVNCLLSYCLERSLHVRRNLELWMQSLLCLVCCWNVYVPAYYSNYCWRPTIHSIQWSLRSLGFQNMGNYLLDHGWWLRYDGHDVDHFLVPHVLLLLLRTLRSNEAKEQMMRFKQKWRKSRKKNCDQMGHTWERKSTI